MAEWTKEEFKGYLKDKMIELEVGKATNETTFYDKLSEAIADKVIGYINSKN